MAINADRIKAVAEEKPETREVHVPQWADPATGDDVVLVRGLTGTEWDRHQAASQIIRDGKTVGRDGSNVSAKLILPCLVDEFGARLFDDTPANYVMLGKLGIRELNLLGEAVLELSGLTADEEDETEGNSDGAPGADSSSD